MTTLRDINCSEASDRAAFYVLGALDARAAAEVREHLETCSRAHEEFAELGSVVPHLAEMPDPLDPPDELRGRILGAVEADVRARRREGDAAERLVASFGARPQPAAAPPEVTAAGVPVGPGRHVDAAPDAARSDQRTGTPLDQPTLGTAETPSSAAEPTSAPASIPPPRVQPAPLPVTAEPAPSEPTSTATASASAAAATDTRERPAGPVALEPTPIPGTDTERRRRVSVGRWLAAAAALLALVALAGWNVLLQTQAAEEHRRTAALAEALIARSMPNAAVAALAGTDAAPGASGTAIMPPGRAGYLVVQGLRPAPAGKTYQAWFMSEAEARSAGLLTVGDDGMGVMTGLQPPSTADAIAVTMENAGGAERPTQPPLVHGRITSPGS